MSFLRADFWGFLGVILVYRLATSVSFWSLPSYQAFCEVGMSCQIAIHVDVTARLRFPILFNAKCLSESDFA